MRIFLSVTLLWIGLFGFAAAAELKDENLLVVQPKGYKVGHQARNRKIWMTEWVPEAETVKNWSELVATQVFFRVQQTPQQFRQSMAVSWGKACPKSGFRKIQEGKENGYPYAYFLLTCPVNPQTQKPEITSIKAIQGNDSFYVVQKAWRFSPDVESVKKWAQFMARVRVCDTRLKDRPCKTR